LPADLAEELTMLSTPSVDWRVWNTYCLPTRNLLRPFCSTMLSLQPDSRIRV